jgi:hypothetical protein
MVPSPAQGLPDDKAFEIKFGNTHTQSHSLMTDMAAYLRMTIQCPKIQAVLASQPVSTYSNGGQYRVHPDKAAYPASHANKEPLCLCLSVHRNESCVHARAWRQTRATVRPPYRAHTYMSIASRAQTEITQATVHVD